MIDTSQGSLDEIKSRVSQKRVPLHIIQGNLGVIEGLPKTLMNLKGIIKAIKDSFRQACTYLTDSLKFYELKKIGETIAKEYQKQPKLISEMFWGKLFMENRLVFQ